MIGDRFKRVREIKGYSQEFPVDQLHISQSAYSDLENNKTKLGLNRLQKNADILDTEIIELLSNNITFSDNQKDGVANNAYIINQLSDPYEKRLKEKDEVIDLLKSQLLNR